MVSAATARDPLDSPALPGTWPPTTRPAAAPSCAAVPFTPSIISWTDHALIKAETLGIARADVEAAVLDRYATRARNGGAGDWKLVRNNVVVIFNHPDRDDDVAARIVTLWRRR